MLTIKNLLTLSFMFTLTACSSTTDIQIAEQTKSKFDEALIYDGKEVIIHGNPDKLKEYRVYHRAASGFVPVAALRRNAQNRAALHCSKQNKINQTVKERVSVPPYVFGNFPRIEIIFVCINKPAAQNHSLNSEDIKYNKLVNLKKLLDDGILTQQEFEQEKAKILND